MLESYLTGLVVCGGIIMAIGAQNAYVLGLAIRRQHHWWSAGVCMGADLLLLSGGMLGITALLLAVPQALEAMRWAGVVFLAWLAIQALWRAAAGRQGLDGEVAAGPGRRRVVLATLAVTLLNPQVYLDTLLLIPAVGAQQSSVAGFLAGAVSASILWFSLLAWGGAALAPWLSRPLAWRAIDGAIGVMMAAIALHLASGAALSPALAGVPLDDDLVSWEETGEQAAFSFLKYPLTSEEKGIYAFYTPAKVR